MSRVKDNGIIHVYHFVLFELKSRDSSATKFAVLSNNKESGDFFGILIFK